MALISPVLAADFNVQINREYTLEATGEFRIVETHSVTNNSTELLISNSNTETFHISVINSKKDTIQSVVDGVKIVAEGVERDYTTTIDENSAQLEVQYPRSIRGGETITFSIEYVNPGLVEDKGALIDVYAPGFAEGFKFEEGQTAIKYNTVVNVAQSYEEENFVIPSEHQSETGESYRMYSFTQESLIGTTIWLQIGRTQNYNFLITQEANATDASDTGFFNEYRLIMPRDIKESLISQTVYYTKISPEPFQIVEDEEGNLIGYFKIPTHQNAQIILEGYAIVTNIGVEADETNSGVIGDYEGILLDEYTGQAEYWEVDSAEIQGLATTLKGDEQNVYHIILNTYEHVIDTIDYSQVKRFGLNERQGALKTLQGGAAVCMEYSDLFLTLTRAEGIPARAAFGYGYDSKLAESEQEAHQWVQVYLPGNDSWISVDVTWGESGPALIGGDLNHFFTHVAGDGPNTPAMVERISYGDDVELNPPDFAISVTDSVPNTSEMLSQQQILEKYPEKSNDLAKLFKDFDFSSYDMSQLSILFILLGIFITGSSVIFLGYMFISSKKKKKKTT
ncbi:transglutaminase domain-containing protein [Candidatus Dojkabacteria bacterium]|uniref:Transglutaminase domain-containing protein n=1 Tax=Candidatus Dojkabacteria bacterium TaxID=2099670 RepID=A0A955L4P7_9BACT|nr:transglutaminase domain-containing protein [Candidatus Dojkabacteria bacterium]